MADCNLNNYILCKQNNIANENSQRRLYLINDALLSKIKILTYIFRRFQTEEVIRKLGL